MTANLGNYTTVSDSATNIGNKIMDSFAAAIGNIVYLSLIHIYGTRFTQLRALEPYYYANPWSAALAGKHVLVVHPLSLIHIYCQHCQIRRWKVPHQADFE